MGFFSFITMDTKRSVSNVYSSLGSFKVAMMDDKGNVWSEDNYQGYGEFGGKDYYELLAEMNGIECGLSGAEYNDFMRKEGIKLYFSNQSIIMPNIVENVDNWAFLPDNVEQCPNQGYFY